MTYKSIDFRKHQGLPVKQESFHKGSFNSAGSGRLHGHRWVLCSVSHQQRLDLPETHTSFFAHSSIAVHQGLTSCSRQHAYDQTTTSDVCCGGYRSLSPVIMPSGGSSGTHQPLPQTIWFKSSAGNHHNCELHSAILADPDRRTSERPVSSC